MGTADSFPSSIVRTQWHGPIGPGFLEILTPSVCAQLRWFYISQPTFLTSSGHGLSALDKLGPGTYSVNMWDCPDWLDFIPWPSTVSGVLAPFNVMAYIYPTCRAKGAYITQRELYLLSALAFIHGPGLPGFTLYYSAPLPGT